MVPNKINRESVVGMTLNSKNVFVHRPIRGQTLYDKHCDTLLLTSAHIVLQTSVCDYNFIVHQTCVPTLKDLQHKGRNCWTYIKCEHVDWTRVWWPFRHAIFLGKIIYDQWTRTGNDIRHYPNYNHQTYYNQFHYPRQIIVCEAQVVYCSVITWCFVRVQEISVIC